MTRGTRRRLALVVGLALLAPTVGEFLLGNIPISQYASVLLLAPLYGGGALLVRETARGLGRGWPTMVLLAAAYALVEEGPVDQMVFNPAYLGLPSFAGYAEIPGLAISGTLVLWSLALHTVWSICVPIALVESFDAAPTVPWLGRRGLTITACVFVTGCVFLGWSQADELRFVGSPAQFIASAVAIGGMIAAALLVGRHPSPSMDAAVPAPGWVGLAAFALSSLYWLGTDLPVDPSLSAAAQVVLFIVAGSLAVGVVTRWSRGDGWDGRHRLALAAGAAATYALWFGPAQALAAGTGLAETAWGALVFGGGAVVVVYAAAHRQRGMSTSSPTGPSVARSRSTRIR